MLSPGRKSTETMFPVAGEGWVLNSALTVGSKLGCPSSRSWEKDRGSGDFQLDLPYLAKGETRGACTTSYIFCQKGSSALLFRRTKILLWLLSLTAAVPCPHQMDWGPLILLSISEKRLGMWRNAVLKLGTVCKIINYLLWKVHPGPKSVKKSVILLSFASAGISVPC